MMMKMMMIKTLRKKIKILSFYRQSKKNTAESFLFEQPLKEVTSFISILIPFETLLTKI